MGGLLLLFVVTLLLLLLCFYSNGKDILTPSVVVCALFAVSEMVALLSVDTWGIDYSLEAALILILGISIFVIVDLFYYIHLKNKRIIFHAQGRKRNLTLDNSGNLIIINKYILWIIIVVNVVYIPVFYLSLMRIAASQGLQGALGMAMKSLSYDAARSVDTNLGIATTLLGRFCLITGYVLLFYFHNNRALIKRKPELNKYKKYNRLLLIPSICYMVASLFQGSRIQILLFLVYYFAVSYITTQKSGHRWSRKDSMKYIKYALILVVVALPLFYLVLNVLGRSNANLGMFNYLAIYIGGSIQQFNQFVQDPVVSNVWGKECFNPVYNFLWKLGLRSEYIPPHLEFRTLYKIGTSGDRWYLGNVYTFFRSPLADFGLGGMVLVTLFFALFYSIYYHNSIKKNNASEYSIIIYAYLFAQLSMVSIANQLTIMISVYGLFNIALFIVMIYVINKFCKKISVESISTECVATSEPLYAGVRSLT